LIKGITENSPAQKGGLQAGDIITKVNRKPVKTAAQVQKLVESSSVGDILEIEVNRNDKIQAFKIQSGTYPKS
jgi:S1-C subfamily serine protease